ncbi:MAG: hypothetical protein V1747_02345 [Candidatus Omnitrophota bacterium]
MNNINTVLMSQVIPFFKLTWTSLIFWRSLSFSLLVLIISFFLFKENIKRWLLQTQRTKHDKELFQLLDLLMPERKLLDLLEKLEKANAYEISSLQFIDKFRSSLNEKTRQFLTPKIKKASKTCKENLDNLREFMDNNFMLFPDTADSDAAGKLMHPNPEIDGGGNEKAKSPEKFAQFTNQLNTRTAAVKKSYQKYRALVKDIIQI